MNGTYYEAFRAFDNNIHPSVGSSWGNNRSWYGGNNEAYIGYNFEEDVSVYKFVIINSGHSSGSDQQYGVKDISLQYYNDEGNWINIENYQNTKDLLATTNFYNKNIDIKAKKWRIYISSTWDVDARKIIGELKFYCK